LIAIVAVAAGVHALGLDVATIGTRFHTVVDGREIAGIPSLPPAVRLPWAERGFSFGLVRQLLPSAFAIAMLGAIESLLSAVVAAALLFANRMAEQTQTKLVQGDDGEEVSYELPPHVAVFEVAGALFFGAAREALSTIESIATDVRVVVLGLGRTGVIDASGL